MRGVERLDVTPIWGMGEGDEDIWTGQRRKMEPVIASPALVIIVTFPLELVLCRCVR